MEKWAKSKHILRDIIFFSRRFVKENRNPNTVRKTENCMSRFTDWLKEEKNETRSIMDVDPITLDIYVGGFLYALKNKEGQDYEPDTLTSYHRSIDRYLRENKYPESIITSDSFRTSREVLATRRKQLKAKGKGNKPNAAQPLTNEHFEKFWDNKSISIDDPTSLQNGLFMYIVQCLGFRGRNEGRQLMWGDLMHVSTENGEEFLEFNERLSKTRTGEFSTSSTRKFAPKMFKNTSNPDRCPIMLYKEFESRRPSDMLTPDSPFFLAVNHNRSKSGQWYKKAPLGEHSLAKIVPEMCKKNGIHGKFSNHSLRKI